jgi:hypothetical protein
MEKVILPHVLVIHGGAGTISRADSTLEQQARFKASLSTALEAASNPSSFYYNLLILGHRVIIFFMLVVKLSMQWLLQ